MAFLLYQYIIFEHCIKVHLLYNRERISINLFYKHFLLILRVSLSGEAVDI